jgi:RNase H-like domain found in reverse transcriptase/Integrase core domain/Chromo (CHRromatin Organisation MOdifier) domain
MLETFHHLGGVFVFFDNILLVTSGGLLPHVKLSNEVMDIMEEQRLTPKPTKCQVLRTRLNFLIFVLGRNGFDLRPDLRSQIADTPQPVHRDDMKSFLGAAGLLRLYAPELSEHSKLLQPHATAAFPATIVWTQPMVDAFERIRTELARPLQLCYWSDDSPATVYTDASPHAIAGVVLISGPDEVQRPLAFWSRSLDDTKQAWTMAEKEMYALIVVLLRFRHVLLPRVLTIYCDNQVAVATFKRGTSPVEKVQRWITKYKEFDVKTLEYVRSEDNPADLGTRAGADAQVLEQDFDQCFALADVESDDEFEFPEHCFEVVEDEDDADSKLVRDEEIPLWYKLPYTLEQLATEQANDRVLQLSQHPRYKRIGDIIVHVSKDGNTIVPVIPHNLIEPTLQFAHRGHTQQANGMMFIRHLCHIPDLKRLTRAYVKKCEHCMTKTSYSGHGAPPLKAIEADGVNDGWAIDFFQLGDRKVLNIIDMYSSLSMAVETKDQTASSALSALMERTLEHGKPRWILADNGPHFVSAEFKAKLRELGIEVRYSSPTHPQTNGRCERSNATLKALLRENADLRVALHEHNFRVRKRTGVSPAQVYYRQARALDTAINPVHVASEIDIDALEEKMQAQVDKMVAAQVSRSPPKLAKGDIVYLKNSGRFVTKSKYEGPFAVVSVASHSLRARRLRDGRVFRAHISHARPGFTPVLELKDDDSKSAQAPVSASAPARVEATDQADDEFEVESVTEHEMREGELFFKVSWVGYPDQDTWEPLSNLGSSASRVLNEYMRDQHL